MSEFTVTNVGKFVFRVAIDRFYNPSGVWALPLVDRIRIGLSDFFQQRSGDIAFVEIKPAGTVVKIDDEIASIETIKVNISIPSPVAGKIVSHNPFMETVPETINQDPYGEGWLCEIDPTRWETDQKNLLDAETYFARMKREAENEVRKSD